MFDLAWPMKDRHMSKYWLASRSFELAPQTSVSLLMNTDDYLAVGRKRPPFLHIFTFKSLVFLIITWQRLRAPDFEVPDFVFVAESPPVPAGAPPAPPAPPAPRARAPLTPPTPSPAQKAERDAGLKHGMCYHRLPHLWP